MLLLLFICISETQYSDRICVCELEIQLNGVNHKKYKKYILCILFILDFLLNAYEVYLIEEEYFLLIITLYFKLGE
jgi:hypothetical protein